MKKIIISLLFFIFLTTARSQPQISWQACFGGSGYDCGTSFLKNESKLILFGTTTSNDYNIPFNYGMDDYFLIWTDKFGNFETSKIYGGSKTEQASKIIRTLDNNYLLFGNSGSNDNNVQGHFGTGWSDIWIVKVDTAGNILWSKCLGGSNIDEAGSDIYQTSDSGFVFIASTTSNDYQVTLNHGAYDYWLVKTDKNGNILWEKSYGDEYNQESTGLLMLDNGYLISGMTMSHNGQIQCNGHGGEWDAWILRVDSMGNIIWQNCLGGNATDNLITVRKSNDGNYMWFGITTSTDQQASDNHGKGDIWVVKTDTSGNYLWSKCYGGSDDDVMYDVIASDHGSFLICGYTFSFDQDVYGNHSAVNYCDGWLIKINGDGQLLWQQCYGGIINDYLPGVNESPQGYIYAIGGSETTNSSGNVQCNHHLYSDIWFLSLVDSTTVGIEHNENLKSIQVYPNPAKDVVHIRLSQDLYGSDIFLTNYIGQQVLSRKVNSDNKDLSLDISNINPGIYFLQILLNGETVKTAKLVIR